MKDTVVCKEILDFIANTCFYGDYCYIDEKCHRLEQPRSIGCKVEVVFETILEQRRLHIERLAEAKDPRLRGSYRWTALSTLKFSEDDMKTLMNAWRLNVELWMNPETLEVYWGQ